ncbi:hypothetical protein LINPERPRIM_LOCUS42737 [Linum perenne]
MDLKGITWVGDVYQKFEAMCLEVEETMYEDTVKFVENQVQTVGASMKKFCADVMKDLAPEDSAKVTAFDRSVELHSAKSSDLSSAFLCRVDDLQRDSARGSLERYSKGIPTKKSSLGIGKSCKREKTCQHQEPGLAYPTLTKTSRRKGSCINQEVSFDQQARLATSGSERISWNDRIEESKTDTVEAKALVTARSTDDMLSNRAISPELGSYEQLDAGNPSSNNSLVESDHSYVSEGYFSLASDSTDADACSAKLSRKFAYTEDCSSSSERPSDWDIDMILDDCSTDQNLESDRQTGNAKLEGDPLNQQQVGQVLLEESCVVVNEDEFDFVSHHEGKSSSYKKRFKDVFSSRRRSLRKLAELKTVDTRSGEEQSERRSVSAFTEAGVAKVESCDHEWELV